jgi:Fe-Mn family superoxide dismutase
LEPYISKKAMDLHYNGHQKTYLDTLNSLPEVINSEQILLEDLILKAKQEKHLTSSVHVIPPKPQSSHLYNMAAQVYNHTFFFRSLRSGGGKEPKDDIADIIKSQYGNYDSFFKKIKARAKNLFGSGWIWIVLDEDNDLRILQGLNADTPFVYGMVPLLVIDVWEHAFYVDYENKKENYIDAVIENLLNWEFANENLKNID